MLNQTNLSGMADEELLAAILEACGTRADGAIRQCSEYTANPQNRNWKQSKELEWLEPEKFNV
ncbi:hypothetical protein SAMN04488502_101502 [Dendrosporobacter quercicolus]|uniref:Uncharacterized protein n=1 Tax=Dendrosporobacter quercicolus TaxID=146817 RepID=A0A1G9LYF1_9FIRM|nr:hypothetical protein [Dendrosporobacter quercicolus]SDL66761.1 hypothetical protein SAMN04488502_101502 [Dendrosporobacter quercicolus]